MLDKPGWTLSVHSNKHYWGCGLDLHLRKAYYTGSPTHPYRPEITVYEFTQETTFMQAYVPINIFDDDD